MRYIGLVRNVMRGREGLHREVLLGLDDGAGARDARSHLTTGNLTFDAAPSQLDGVLRLLEDGIAQVIGRREPVVVREAAWFRDLVASDPFAAFPVDRWEIAVAFLPVSAAPIDPAAVPTIDGLEAVAVRPHELLMAGRRDVHGRAPPTCCRGRGGTRSRRGPGARCCDWPRSEVRTATVPQTAWWR